MSRLRRLFRDQTGFTMIAVITGMLVVSLFALGAYSAALGDITAGRKDQDHKRADEAAKAGIEWYVYHLLRDPNYWTYCNDASKVATPGLSLQGMNRPASSWRTIPGSTAQFQTELMTADGTPMTQAECLADPGKEMLNGGVLKIRSTGRANGKQRQIVASFRRNTFLDYLWYTGFETQPPQAYDPGDAPAGQDPATACDAPRNVRPSWCVPIQFAANDSMLGPMHTEDSSFLVCNSPTFGRTKADNLEITAATSPSNAYTAASGCSANPVQQGFTVAPAKSLDLPPSNAGLQSVASIITTGKTCATFSGSSVTIRTGMTWNGSIDCSTGGTMTTYPLGANTVIYTKNGTAVCGAYAHLQKYDESNSCGDIAVQGTYGSNVTIGAANDIIVRDELLKSGNAMMGLIATNFVRVYHPGTWNSSGACVSGTVSNTRQVAQIDAAVLALNYSFMNDNWDCGNALGNLQVNGTIAQRWRGAVGTGSCGSGTGYCKDYRYDDRLKYREPPEYLDPQKASWHLLRQSEQSPVQ